jgi:hypothetical protein
MTNATTQTTVTFADIEREVRRLAAERPDYKYENPNDYDSIFCSYDHGDGTGCIMGMAFAALGVQLEDVGGVAEALSWARPDVLASLTPKQRDWLSCVQTAQDGYGFDSRMTWSEAVAHADQERPLR